MSELRYKNLDICHAKEFLSIWTDVHVIKYTNMKLPYTFAFEDVENRIEIFNPLDVVVGPSISYSYEKSRF